MMRIGLVGFGEIGRSIIAALPESASAQMTIVALCCRGHQLAEASAMLPQAVVSSDIAALLAAAPDIVVEAAGHQAVRQIGPAVLRAGCKFYVLSVGAYADDALLSEHLALADASGGQIIIPAGALAGFDGLMSLKVSGLDKVTYRSVKPPLAWRGTLAERSVGLDDLAHVTTFFRGSARQAAVSYPQNANLAAAVALAGAGFDRTEVELVADPGRSDNEGVLLASGPAGEMELRLVGNGFDSNPKSSIITGLSVIAALDNDGATLSFR